MLTCGTNSSSFLYWTVSVPHQATTPERIVANQGVKVSPAFSINFARFSITRTSDDPLISELRIDNVTAGINGSTIYCSEDGNEYGAPMIAIYIIGSFASKCMCVILMIKCFLYYFGKRSNIIVQNFLVPLMWV